MSLGIIIVGALGRMGREIAEIVSADGGCFLRGALEGEHHPMLGTDYGTCIGKGTLGVAVKSSLGSVDCTDSVAIDFSSPKSLKNLLPAAAEKKLPLVIGTTGLTSEDTDFIRSFSPAIPILVSPNMSLGVNLLFAITISESYRFNPHFSICDFNFHLNIP